MMREEFAFFLVQQFPHFVEQNIYQRKPFWNSLVFQIFFPNRGLQHFGTTASRRGKAMVPKGSPAAPEVRRFRQLGGWWTPRPGNPDEGCTFGGLSGYNKESNNNSIAGWHDAEFAHAHVCTHMYVCMYCNVMQCNAMQWNGMECNVM